MADRLAGESRPGIEHQRVAVMSFMLVYQHGEGRENKTERFETERAAITRACALIAEGGSRYLNIENEGGFIVVSESEIRRRCEGRGVK
jgi:hypothetical protein